MPGLFWLVAVVALHGLLEIIRQRAIRAAALSVDDAAQVVRVIASRRRGNADVSTALEDAGQSIAPDAAPAPMNPHGRWADSWSGGDWFSVAFGAVSLLLILAVPWLTGRSVAEVWQQILTELKPFPD